ncbi:hypothetical protein G6L16_000745 [Agrobacterium tumefaciens]|uniref:hypothetical protein n=1 Tax=Agrobacterium tumefaciens TaxID=358 RepID=UPI00157358FC|nr:hypothetical protein [Agrobacterium tumefaciens]NSZ61859.1 hypothetical protein [Agrobacterium tumefaciens]NTA68231.1 hypothetical protein [Agrobacterium tumefaciens]WIE38070.1 hypothetical protein G6L16_000745 [Agrobacterium tumefaciens]
MPSSTVPATAEGMPRLNRAEIMSDAWERYRDIRRRYATWQIARGIVDASFSACLKTAWRVAKQNRTKAADAAKVAALAGTPAGERLRALQSALSQTGYLSLRYSAAARRVAIKSEIASIVAH